MLPNAIPRKQLFTASCLALLVTSLSFGIRAGILGKLGTEFNLSGSELGTIAATAFWGISSGRSHRGIYCGCHWHEKTPGLRPLSFCLAGILANDCGDRLLDLIYFHPAHRYRQRNRGSCLQSAGGISFHRQQDHQTQSFPPLVPRRYFYWYTDRCRHELYGSPEYIHLIRQTVWALCQRR